MKVRRCSTGQLLLKKLVKFKKNTCNGPDLKLYQKRAPSLMFCCYFYEIIKDNFNTENLCKYTSEKLDIISNYFKYY